MNRPAALLFDLDGTLVDTALGIAAALSELSRRRGGGTVDAALVRGLISRGVAVLVREALGSVAGDSAEDIGEFRAILRQSPGDREMIYPGAIEALHGLAASGHRCAVVTNKPESLSRQLLGELDLARFFDAVVGGDSLPCCKPDPAPLLYALHELEAAPHEAVMIGDSDVDAAAARNAGVPFVLFEGGYGPVAADCLQAADRFADFAGLPALLHQDSRRNDWNS